jgi:hypothetical protein
MRKNYKYRVKYFMKAGKEFQGPEIEGRSQKLFINDVFDARQTVAVRGVGDFTNRIQTIFVDLEYTDGTNNYTLTRSQALTGASPFFEWTFPVVNDKAGKVTYKATIAYKDGSNEILQPVVAASNTILLPPAVEAFLDVQVVADLVDWTQVRLVRVALSYTDVDTNVSQSKDLIFSATNKANTTWRVELKNKLHDQFTYAVTYYLVSGMQKTVGPKTTRDRALILDHTQKVERAPLPMQRPTESLTAVAH